MVKNLPEIEETWETQSLGWEDPLEKGIGNPLQYGVSDLASFLPKKSQG